ncbi:hypothetical protein MMC19_002276 [Ptychographa xylographoides]|nr:hypothetical protein [Ptychographa xylographoides]
MHLLSLVLVGALAAGSFAAPALTLRHVVHESRRDLPKTWVKRSAVEADALLPVRVGLKQRNLDKGHDLLMEVSQPGSTRYGQHYSAEEVADLFAPAQSTVDAVRNWLIRAGVPAKTISQSVNRGWIQFDSTTSDLEKLLQTKYYVYENEVSGHTNVACDEYHVPTDIQGHIDYITPGTKLLALGGGLKARKRYYDFRPIPEGGQAGSSSCGTAITPQCVKELYNVTAPTLSSANNSMGIYESGDTYAQADLNDFFKNEATNIPQGTHPTLKSVDGGTAPVAVGSAGGESDLDFELAYPLIYPQTITLFQTDDDNYANSGKYLGIFNTFLDALDGSYCTYSAFGITGDSSGIDPPYPDPANGGYKGNLECGVYKPTNVISISYGEQENQLPRAYQERQCNEFMKLGLQGTSILVASGDDGVTGPDDRQGANTDCLGTNHKVFSPSYPNSCPYITNVGSTTLPAGADASKDAEVATTRFGSGGGFSNIYGIPDYQASAVAAYFKNHNPTYPYYSNLNNSYGSGIYNRIGRGIPDVSAVGDNIVVWNQGAKGLSGGTSASTPVFAAILNRINEELIAAGKSTIGFANPALYTNPSMLHDITVGVSNPTGGAPETGCGTKGFSAATGWDPVTGLGTPNYPAMLEYFMSVK